MTCNIYYKNVNEQKAEKQSDNWMIFKILQKCPNKCPKSVRINVLIKCPNKMEIN
jgi:hypothetical protein